MPPASSVPASTKVVGVDGAKVDVDVTCPAGATGTCRGTLVLVTSGATGTARMRAASTSEIGRATYDVAPG